MDKQREEFEAWAYRNKWNTFRVRDMGLDHYVDDFVNGAWEGWQQAKKSAVPEGFVVVPREPYAYLIKHKLWKKDSDPEIFLAVDFLGDDGVEKDKLVVCKPLYLGGDEAQEN